MLQNLVHDPETIVGDRRFLVFEALGIGLRDEEGHTVLRGRSTAEITWPKDMIRGRRDKEQLVAMWEFHTKLAFDEDQNPEASAESDTPVDVLEFPGELGKGIIRNRQTRLDGWTKPSQTTAGTWLLNQFLDESYPDIDGEDFVMEDDEDFESYREQVRLASSNPRRWVSSDSPDGDDEV